MLTYAICEYQGKQLKVVPNKIISFQGEIPEDKTILANILLLSEDGKIKIGKPYLKEKLTLRCVGVGKGQKLRVSKYHAKANYRKTQGFRPKIIKVVWDVKNS